MVCRTRSCNAACASLAQLVEHRSRKAGVTSSSLVAGSMKSQVVALWRLPFFVRDTWNSLIVLVLPEWRCQVGAAKNALSWYCRNSAAILGASWARFTKLAVSMAVQAILGAFLAALGSMIMLVRSSRFIDGSLKLSINSCLQIRRQPFCFSCDFHMRQRIGTKLDVYGCFDSQLNAQIREKPPLNSYFDL